MQIKKLDLIVLSKEDRLALSDLLELDKDIKALEVQYHQNSISRETISAIVKKITNKKKN